MTARQHALTVIAPLRSDVSREEVARRLVAVERDVQRALETAKTLHFGRFVILNGTPRANLAFESNHDGEQNAHLAELTQVLAPFEDVLFGAWEGYERGRLAEFVTKHALPASTFYLGHPGLAVGQIQNDDRLRARLGNLLDAEIRTRDVRGRSATELRARLLEGLGSDFVTGAVDRGLPAQPWSFIALGFLIVFVVVPVMLVLLPLILLLEWQERRTESERKLITEDDPVLDAINGREDAIGQNGLTHHVPLRVGLVRRVTLRTVLWMVEQMRLKAAYRGELGGISSIHFARWVMLDDDSVLFFSNYDGSWESYLGDFVDKAAIWLSAVWANTKWFPDSGALIVGGASKEGEFKRWTRTFQMENQIWYSAYPHLSVNDVLRNAEVREGAAGEMNESQARAWLARI